MLQSPQYCPIGNWGCPCLPVARKQMMCYKMKIKQTQKMREVNNG